MFAFNCIPKKIESVIGFFGTGCSTAKVYEIRWISLSDSRVNLVIGASLPIAI